MRENRWNKDSDLGSASKEEVWAAMKSLAFQKLLTTCNLWFSKGGRNQKEDKYFFTALYLILQIVWHNLKKLKYSNFNYSSTIVY